MVPKAEVRREAPAEAGGEEEQAHDGHGASPVVEPVLQYTRERGHRHVAEQMDCVHAQRHGQPPELGGHDPHLRSIDGRLG